MYVRFMDVLIYQKTRHGCCNVHSCKRVQHYIGLTWDVSPTSFQCRDQQGITRKILTKFWVKLWERKQWHQMLRVQWMLVHRALPIGTWMHKMGVSSNCGHCHLQIESRKHCPWDWLQTQLVWKHQLIIFANYFLHWYSNGAWWYVHCSSALFFTMVLSLWTMTTSGIVHVLPLVSMRFLGRRKEMQLSWELLSSTTISYIWKVRSSLIFQRHQFLTLWEVTPLMSSRHF